MTDYEREQTLKMIDYMLANSNDTAMKCIWAALGAFVASGAERVLAAGLYPFMDALDKVLDAGIMNPPRDSDPNMN